MSRWRGKPPILVKEETLNDDPKFAKSSMDEELANRTKLKTLTLEPKRMNDLTLNP
jgi:hypothetical protein